ncbi:hypothetical protein [Gynuella sunshinyii]|uniref:LysM domain-containing protein n=1 Tax=Gynuella sunshinyii YC6258 TaxID=1445510 RepID=A0A0C5V3I6_9GAMM|nr:hypothetical protein [Gynuella sunshinyii]AJQ94080.1 hypothetical Protein YC6258_02036 [Gynuella sunshinyii YC6258]
MPMEAKALLELKRKLQQADQEYEVQPGDTLYQLNVALDYVPRTLEFANVERMQSWGRGPTQLLPGDRLYLPQYTDDNHIDRLDERHEAVARGELTRGRAYSQDRNQTLRPDHRQWHSVRLYWGDNQETSFERTSAFPLVYPAKDATKLKHDVQIYAFEPNAADPIADDQPVPVKTFQQQHIDSGTLGATEDVACELSKEGLNLPRDLLYDYKASQKATLHVQSPHKDPDGEDLFFNTSGVIASAVSQYLIARVELMHEINGESDIPKLPNLLTWAFLQPPTIGQNPYRKAAHNKWVVDDSPRAGWFEAEIHGSQATLDSATGLYKAPMKIYHYLYQMNSGHEAPQKHAQKVEDSVAWIKIEANQDAQLKSGAQPNSIALIKYEAVVRSNLTREAFKHQRDSLMAQKKYADLFSLECGCYLKAWVRNLDMHWSKEPEYLDDDPEDLRVRMENRDTVTQDNIDFHTHGLGTVGYNPQLYCNHSWRRERIMDGEWVFDKDGKKVCRSTDSFAEGDIRRVDGNMLYVGLYPSELISALNKLDQPEQPGQPRELNFPVWMGVSIAVSGIAWLMGKLLDRLAERKARKRHTDTDPTVRANKQKPAYWQHHYGKAVLEFLDNFKLKEILAMIAVDGLRNEFDLDKIIEAISPLHEFLKSSDLETLEDRISQVDLSSVERAVNDMQRLMPEISDEARAGFEASAKSYTNLQEAYDDLIKDVKAEINLVRTYEASANIYSQIFRFALIDPTNPFTEDAHQKELDKRDSKVASPDAGFFKRLMGKTKLADADNFEDVFKELRNTFIEGLGEGDLTASTGAIELASLSDTKFSPPPYGRPLPGWLAFLFFARKVHVQGQLNLEVEGKYVTAEERQSVDGRELDEDTQTIKSTVAESGQSYADLLIKLGSKNSDEGEAQVVELEYAYQLMAAWTAVKQANEAKTTKSDHNSLTQDLNHVTWGPMLNDVLDYLEISLSAAAKLSLETELAWRVGYLFQHENNPGRLYGELSQLFSDINLKFPINARLSVFSWSYHIAEAKLANVRTEEASFLSDLKLFGKDLWDKGITVSWGVTDITDVIYRHYNNQKREVYIGDEIGVVLGYSDMEFKPNMSAKFTYVSGGTDQVLIELDSEQFEYVETDQVIDRFDDIATKKALSEHTNISITAMRMTLDVAAEERFAQIRGTEKQQKHILDLSKYNQKMKALWNDIAGASELELQCAVTPQAGDRNDRLLENDDTFILKLPVVRSISAHSELGDKDTLHFAIRIDNYKRDNEYAWVRLYDRDRIGIDDTVRFAVPQDPDKDSQSDQPEYQDWNFMRLSRSETHHREGDTSNVYYLDIPLSWLDKNSIEEAVDTLDSITNTVELTVELAYFASTSLTGYAGLLKWDSYLFKEDLTEGRDVIKVFLDHPLLQ